MKEASGDMTMTIIVIVGAVFVLGIARGVIWPLIQHRVENEVNNIHAYVEVVEDYTF